jgi:hypothetical protein
MTTRRIKAIWFRVLQLGEFYNIERDPRNMLGGRGSLYVEIPKSLVQPTLDFFGEPMPPDGSDGFIVQAIPIGVRGTTASPITVMPKKGGRLRISNQNRQATPNRRHPAWGKVVGFPSAPNGVTDREAANAYFPSGGVRIFIAKLDDDSFAAGFTKGPPPASIPVTSPIRDLYNNSIVGGVIVDLDMPVKGI